VDVSTNDYYAAVWIFATNNHDEPIIGILGQREDSTEDDAKDNNVPEDLSLGTLPFVEGKLLYRLIFITNSGYANTPKAALRDVRDYRANKAGTVNATLTVAEHSGLSGRAASNQHPGAAISLDTTNFDNRLSGTDTEVQTAMETLDESPFSEAAGEINALASEKTAPIDADLILIEDSEDSNNKKKVQIGNIKNSLVTISPTISAQADDWNPSGLSTARCIRLTCTGNQDMTGITAQTDLKEYLFINLGAGDVKFKNENVASLAANRFSMDADVTVKQYQAVHIFYDGTSSRWRVLGVAT
jgi:hypothetical protein